MTLRGLATNLKDVRQAFDQKGQRDAQRLTDAAFELAASEVDDEAARRELERLIVECRPKAGRYCLDRLVKGRETLVGDRADRLLRVAIDREPVRSPDPARLDLIERIRDLDQQPIGDAFAELVAIAPALEQLAATVAPFPEEENERARWLAHEAGRAGKLVGADAAGAAPTIRTHAAHQVVLEYLRIAAGNNELGTAETSVREINRARIGEFERDGWTVERLPGGRVHMSVRHSFTFGRPPGDRRG